MKTLLISGTTTFAATYSCGAYGMSTYQNASQNCTTTTKSGVQPPDTFFVSSTGSDVIALILGVAIVAVAVTIIVTSIIKKKRHIRAED